MISYDLLINPGCRQINSKSLDNNFLASNVWHTGIGAGRATKAAEETAPHSTLQLCRPSWDVLPSQRLNIQAFRLGCPASRFPKLGTTCI